MQIRHIVHPFACWMYSDELTLRTRATCFRICTFPAGKTQISTPTAICTFPAGKTQISTPTAICTFPAGKTQISALTAICTFPAGKTQISALTAICTFPAGEMQLCQNLRFPGQESENWHPSTRTHGYEALVSGTRYSKKSVIKKSVKNQCIKKQLRPHRCKRLRIGNDLRVHHCGQLQYPACTTNVPLFVGSPTRYHSHLYLQCYTSARSHMSRQPARTGSDVNTGSNLCNARGQVCVNMQSMHSAYAQTQRCASMCLTLVMSSSSYQARAYTCFQT